MCLSGEKKVSREWLMHRLRLLWRFSFLKRHFKSKRKFLYVEIQSLEFKGEEQWKWSEECALMRRLWISSTKDRLSKAFLLRSQSWPIQTESISLTLEHSLKRCSNFEFQRFQLTQLSNVNCRSVDQLVVGRREAAWLQLIEVVGSRCNTSCMTRAVQLKVEDLRKRSVVAQRLSNTY